MSPNINSFVGDLVAMAKAMEDLPKVQDELSIANERIDELLQTVQDRELRIQQIKYDGDIMQERINALEVAKDQAETMFLELDEKTHQVLGMLMDFEGKAKGARLILDPLKPEPLPTASSAADTGQSSGQEHPPQTDDPNLPSGQSEGPLSIPAANADGQSSGNSNAGEVASTTANSGPYSGLRYYDHPTYVPFADWIAGGGTEADYNWRPEPKPHFGQF